MAFVYQFEPHSFFGIRDEDVYGLIESTHNLWKSIADMNDHYARIIIHNSRYRMDDYLQTLILKKARSGNKKWMSTGLTSQIDLLQKKTQMNLFQPYVYLVLFEKDLEKSNEFANMFRINTGMTLVGSPATGAILPEIISKRKAIATSSFIHSNNEYWKFFYITDFLGSHDIQSPILSLFREPMEIIASFDIKTFANARIAQILDIKHNQTMANIYGNTNPLTHQQLERQLQTINQARQLVQTKMEAIHEITGVIGFQSKTLKEMKDKKSRIFAMTSGRYTLAEIPGTQHMALDFFSTKIDPRTPGDIRRSVTTGAISHANLVGNGFPSPGGKRGLWFGNSLLNQHPILYDGFGPTKNEPNHTLIFGATGSGKTVLLQTLAWRHLQQNIQVIVLEPRGHFKKIHRLVGQDSQYNDMGFQSGYSINIFDKVYDDNTNQVTHVMNALTLLLKKRFDDKEDAVLRSEITLLYRNYDLITLETLVYGLTSKRWKENDNEMLRQVSSNLADLIRIQILDSDLEGIFNRQTKNINLSLDDVLLMIYDFEKVSKEFQGLLYYLILSYIHNYCIVNKNTMNRIIIVDEYYLMSQIPQLSESLALFFKTFRTYGVAVWVAEQDFFTMTGNSEENFDKNGRYLVSNAANVIALYHNNYKDALRLQEFFPEMKDIIGYITGQKKQGVGIMKLKEKIYPFQLELTLEEENNLLGS